MLNPQAKPSLRDALSAARRALTADQRTSARHGMLRTLGGVLMPAAGRLLSGSMAHRGEADCLLFLKLWLEEGGRLCLPRMGENYRLHLHLVDSFDTLVPGWAAILEPDPERHEEIDPVALDIALVPGLAFDRQGGRLGQGKGYYDRLLGALTPRTLKIGICHDFQVLGTPVAPVEVRSVPMEPHDVRMDALATPTAYVRCEGAT